MLNLNNDFHFEFAHQQHERHHFLSSQTLGVFRDGELGAEVLEVKIFA